MLLHLIYHRLSPKGILVQFQVGNEVTNKCKMAVGGIRTGSGYWMVYHTGDNATCKWIPTCSREADSLTLNQLSAQCRYNLPASYQILRLWIWTRRINYLWYWPYWFSISERQLIFVREATQCCCILNLNLKYKKI